jgi:hypothetical protein
MIDGKVLLIALMALCGANVALIWQVLTLTDMVHDVQDEVHAVAMWLIRREARRMREDGDSDGEDQRQDAQMVR